MTEEELRARLLTEAENVINRLLVEKPADSVMTLTDIERLVLRMGQQVQAEMLKALARASQEAQKAEAPVCEGCISTYCGQGVSWKGEQQGEQGNEQGRIEGPLTGRSRKSD